jgi:tetratricopeptide (TPR) repeat protein
MRDLHPTLTLAVAASMFGVGCGTARPAAIAVTTPNDPPRESRLGTPLTESAEARFGDALASYRSAVADGLTPDECARVADAFERANEEQGGSFAEAIYMVGLTHAQCGAPDEARVHYERALALRGGFCGPRVAAAVEDYRAGRIDAARRELERAVREDTRCLEGYVNLAMIQRRSPTGEADALSNLRRALAIDASYLPAFDQMALLYLERARRHDGGDDAGQLLGLAEVVCRQAQLVEAAYAPLYNTWGLVNVAQGDIIGALAKFERAFTLDEAFFEAHMNFRELTLSFRGYDDAARAFARAAELRPASYDAYLGLGAAQRGRSETGLAEAAYRQAIALDADRPEAYFNLGVLHQDYQGGSDAALGRALDDYREFVARAGDSAAFRETVESVTRTCESICESTPSPAVRPRRRRASSCAMGRIQQIEESLCLGRRMAEASPTAE